MYEELYKLDKMGWTSLVAFNFTNHAAVDETGNGHHGLVKLPGPDRWVDAPSAVVRAAVRFDDPRSKVVIPPRPEFSNWQGVRVRALFNASSIGSRMNLVEGEGAFALFINADGSLQGTINDGSATWWGVSSQPSLIGPNEWHQAELFYSSATLLAVRLNGVVMNLRVTKGQAIRPVGPGGIHLGHWPGGDSQYAFSGLLGSVIIDTLNTSTPSASALGKVVCNKTGNGRVEEVLPLLVDVLGGNNKNLMGFGKAAQEAAVNLFTAIVGSSTAPERDLKTLRDFSHSQSNLLLAHEQAETDVFSDPAFQRLQQSFYNTFLASSSSNLEVLFTGLKTLFANKPLDLLRWQSIIKANPKICQGSIPPLPIPPGWIDKLTEVVQRPPSPREQPP